MFEWLRSKLRGYPLLDESAEPGVFDPVTGGTQAAAIPVSDLAAYDSPHYRSNNGDKWTGGFGPTQLLTADYWTLRARSAQLFETNLYARGLIRRLVTNEINTGLHLDCTPEERLLGLQKDALVDWTEDVENRFLLWGKNPWLCDHTEKDSFGALQAIVRSEALVCGDVLVVLRQQQATGLPRVQLISGNSVMNPVGKVSLRAGNRISHGVELDGAGRQVAYWVKQADGTSKRLPAYGEKSGRRLAWLVYGTDRRLDEVRGKPMLSLVLQSLKEIDRYRDSVQRKATINSMVAMFIEKTQPTLSTKPMTAAGGALRKGYDLAEGADGTPRAFKAAEQIPGLVIEELGLGEKPTPYPSHGTDEKFAEFEAAILYAVAWVHEVPPEILVLAFKSSYSASQASTAEFKMYLNKVRTKFGDDFCTPIYIEWLVSAALAQKITAPKLLESFRDLSQYDTLCAWTSCDWSGHIKPAIDTLKAAKGYAALIEEGLITRDRASREINGTKYTKNVQTLAIENALLAAAKRPLVELESIGKAAAQPAGGGAAPQNGDSEEEGPEREDEDASDDDSEKEAA